MKKKEKGDKNDSNKNRFNKLRNYKKIDEEFAKKAFLLLTLWGNLIFCKLDLRYLDVWSDE